MKNSIKTLIFAGLTTCLMGTSLMAAYWEHRGEETAPRQPAGIPVAGIDHIIFYKYKPDQGILMYVLRQYKRMVNINREIVTGFYDASAQIPSLRDKLESCIDKIIGPTGTVYFIEISDEEETKLVGPSEDIYTISFDTIKNAVMHYKRYKKNPYSSNLYLNGVPSDSVGYWPDGRLVDVEVLMVFENDSFETINHRLMEELSVRIGVGAAGAPSPSPIYQGGAPGY